MPTPLEPQSHQPHQLRHIAESFGTNPERYDRARPRYPNALIERILAASPTEGTAGSAGRSPAANVGTGPGADAGMNADAGTANRSAPPRRARADVLDVGCGTGIAARQFQAAGCRVLGVEPDERMAEFARRGGLDAERGTGAGTSGDGLDVRGNEFGVEGGGLDARDGVLDVRRSGIHGERGGSGMRGGELDVGRGGPDVGNGVLHVGDGGLSLRGGGLDVGDGRLGVGDGGPDTRGGGPGVERGGHDVGGGRLDVRGDGRGVGGDGSGVSGGVDVERGGLDVEVATFEAWEPGGRTFDVVAAAQSWHWVDPVVGVAKAARVLRPGGVLAIFAHVFEPPPPVADAFAAAYRRVVPDSPFAERVPPATLERVPAADLRPSRAQLSTRNDPDPRESSEDTGSTRAKGPFARSGQAVVEGSGGDGRVEQGPEGRRAVDVYQDGFAKLAESIREADGFGNMELWRFDWERFYTRDEWLELLPTTGGLTRLPADKLAEVLDEVGAAIDALGGGFTMSYATLAVVATAGS